MALQRVPPRNQRMLCLKPSLPRLVRILRDMRALLIERGATFRFDTKVEGFLTKGGGERGAIRGLKLADGGEILANRCASKRRNRD